MIVAKFWVVCPPATAYSNDQTAVNATTGLIVTVMRPARGRGYVCRVGYGPNGAPLYSIVHHAALRPIVPTYFPLMPDVPYT